MPEFRGAIYAPVLARKYPDAVVIPPFVDEDDQDGYVDGDLARQALVEDGKVWDGENPELDTAVAVFMHCSDVKGANIARFSGKGYFAVGGKQARDIADALEEEFA